MSDEVESEIEYYDRQRAEVDSENLSALLSLCREYRLYIPKGQFQYWRPTTRCEGEIKGVKDSLTIIATDGLLAFFLTENGEVFQGHIQDFTGKVKILYSTTAPQKRRRTVTKRTRITVEFALEALMKLGGKV